MDEQPAGMHGSNAAFRPGDRLLARFSIVREVARGGMGIVYEAIDEKLERRIAVKTAKPGHGRLLPPEVRNASTVSHPNVCKIFEVHTAATQAGDADFLTMEFLEGETLARRLARGPLPKQEAQAVARQICSGLAEAHRNHIVHGDLKSSNIFLEPAQGGTVRAVITDFGLAQGPRQVGVSGGTPGYMAPELLAGGSISVASDIWSLGVVLHELVSGQRPDERAMRMASTITLGPGESQKQDRPAEQPLPLHSKWDPIVARCLAPEPSERYPDVASIERALHPPRRRWVFAPVAAILMATAAAVTYWRTTAPPETVKLAVESTLPLGAALQEVKGTPQRGFTVTGNRGRATHVLTVRTEARDTGQMVSVQLTDTRNQARLATWEGVYDANEMAHAPAGVAGVASAALHVEPRPATTAFHSAEALTWYETALALLRQDDRIDDALVLLERAAAEEPSSGLPLAGIAEGAYRKYVLTNAAEWLERSKEAVRRAALRGQDSAPVHRIAGLLLANEGQFAPAIARYQRATELSATNSDAWRRLGEAYQRVNQLDQALAALEHAVEIEPEYYRTHQDLGGYFINRGNYTAAIPELRRAVELAPENPTLRSALATALKNIGEFAAAEKELRFGLTLREEPRVLHALGQVLMYESRESEAIPYFRRALEKDQSRFLSWLYLGNCLLRTKQVAEARAAYQQGLATVEPLVIDQQDGRRRAFLAYLCARLGDAHRAEVEIAQALGATPDGADAQWMAALTYEVLGKRDEALRVLRSAPPELLADLARWPEAADLTHDERFSKMLPTPGKSP